MHFLAPERFVIPVIGDSAGLQIRLEQQGIPSRAFFDPWLVKCRICNFANEPPFRSRGMEQASESKAEAAISLRS
jgi:hypothetical protein